MKEYSVSLDITMCKTLYVEAESEEQSMEIARKRMEENPYDETYNFSHMVGYEVTDAIEV